VTDPDPIVVLKAQLDGRTLMANETGPVGPGQTVVGQLIEMTDPVIVWTMTQLTMTQTDPMTDPAPDSIDPGQLNPVAQQLLIVVTRTVVGIVIVGPGRTSE